MTRYSHETTVGMGLEPIVVSISNVEEHSIDIESSKSAWLCVLGSFMFLIPTFGNIHVSIFLDALADF